MKRHQELKTRILVLLLGGLALPVILLAVAVVVLLMKFETTRRTEQNLTYVARSVVQQVDALLDRAAAAALASGIDGTIVSALKQPVTDSSERQLRLSRHLDELAGRYGIFDLVAVVDRTGYLLATNLKTPHLSRLDLSRAPQLCWGQDLKIVDREGPWIQQALKDEVSHSGAMKLNRGISPVAGCLAAPGAIDDIESFFVRYATPVKDNQTTVGVIVFYLSWRLVQKGILDKATKELERAGYDSGYAFMYDQDQRTIIGHPNRKLYNTDLVNTHHLNTLHEAVLQGQSSHTYEYPPGVPKIAGLARCSSPTGFGWTVGAGVNFPDIYGRVIWLGAGYAAAVIVLALIASYFALRMTRQFRLSVDQLIQTAGRVARGEMPGTVNIQSKDEMGHLAEAFNEMAETLRRRFRASEAIEKPFREIRPNPYLFGNPIKNKEMFFGRRAEFALAREKLARARGGLTLVFFGDRRSGKTSILYQLKNGALGDDFVCVFVDLQGLATVTSEDEFYESLAVEIAEAVPGAKSSPVWPDGTGAKGFKEFLQRLLRSLQDKRLIILFDEYETIDILINRGCLSSQVVPFLASLTEAEPPMSFVLSGSSSIEQQVSPHWAALIPKSHAIEIGLLSREDALALIQDPVADLVEFDFGIPVGIVRLTGGHAYYTQVVCQNLVDHLNRVRHNLCDARNLAAVVDEVIQNPPPQMLYFWKQLAIPEKITLSLLAEVLGDEASVATTADLMARAVEYPVAEPITGHILSQILGHFSAKGHLEEPEKGRFRFRLDLFRLRIKRVHSMWQVLREEAKSS